MTPYCSPIYVQRVQPLKTGNGLLRLEFFNALYAEGVQEFEIDLKVLKRAKNYLIADLPYDTERSAIIGHIEFSWLAQSCPALLVDHPPRDHSSVSVYLDAVFGSGRAT